MQLISAAACAFPRPFAYDPSRQGTARPDPPWVGGAGGGVPGGAFRQIVQEPHGWPNPRCGLAANAAPGGRRWRRRAGGYFDNSCKNPMNGRPAGAAWLRTPQRAGGAGGGAPRGHFDKSCKNPMDGRPAGAAWLQTPPCVGGAIAGTPGERFEKSCKNPMRGRTAGAAWPRTPPRAGRAIAGAPGGGTISTNRAI